MKRKYFLIGLLIAVLTLSVAIFAACETNPNTNDKNNNNNQSSDNSGVIDGSGDGYEEQLYTYSFDSVGGSKVDGGQLYKNEYIPAPAKPTRAGYAFTGWYYDEDCTRLCEFIYTRMPDHDVTFYAGWRQLYTIFFETYEGSPVEPLEGDAGEHLTAEQVASIVTQRVDYVFEGWYLDEEFNYRVYLSTNTTFPSEDKTVYAKWRPLNKSVTVTLIDTKGDDDASNDETTVKEALVEGSKLQLQDGVLSESGKYLEFACWALSENGGNPVPSDYTVPSKDVTLYAIYHQKADWAYVTVNPSPYLRDEYKGSGISFYIMKGITLGNLAADQISLPIGNTALIAWLRDSEALARQSLTCDYLITATGTRYSSSSNSTSVIASNMTLSLEIISDGLVYDGVYTYRNDTSGIYGYFYGEDDIKAFLGKEEVTDSDLLLFQKRYYFVKSYTGTTATDVYVPSTYWKSGDQYRYWTIGIGKGVFKNNTLIERVTLPDSIQWIEDNAFDGCTSLVSVNLPEKLMELGDSAFRNTKVEQFVIPENLSYVGYKVFENTPFEKALFKAANGGSVYLNKDRMLYGYAGELSGSITVSKESVMVICGGAFANQNNIVRVTVSDSVVYICAKAFKDCKNLKSVTLGKYVAYVFEEAFDGCTKLSDLVLNNKHTLRMVGAHAFRNTAITSFYFGMSFVTLGEGAFEGCSKLKTAEMYSEKMLVNGVTYYLSTLINYIPKNAFKDCVSLTSFKVMDEVLEIAGGAFEGCTSLQDITLGDTAQAYIYAIRKDAFKGCTNLRRVIVTKPAKSVEDCIEFEDGCFDESLNKFYIQVSAASRDYYLRAMSATEATDEADAKPESKYIGRVVTTGSGAPVITVKNAEVAIGQTYGFVIDAAFVQQYAQAEDTTYSDLELTPADKLLWTIMSVTYNGEVVKPNADGTYDLIESGIYTINFRVSDEYGVSSVSKINILVQSNVI